MNSKTVSILEGNTFVVSDLQGDIDASPSEPTGLFSWDTRMLSRWILTLNGVRPDLLSTDDLSYYAIQFFLVPGTGTIYINPDLSIFRKRMVGRGFHEELLILNHRNEAVDLTVRMEAGSDFADLFEVKDALTKKGELYQRIEDGRLVLGYRRERFVRETWVTSSAPAEIDGHGLTFEVHLEPQGSWSTDLDVVAATAVSGMKTTRVKYLREHISAKPEMQLNLEQWIENAPRLTCDWNWFERIYQRSLVDLAALRYYPRLLSDKSLPAAGLPWFMTIFGRDSVIASLQSLPFTPELAGTTLVALAAQQGTIIDDFRDEEPGKILHEVRFGELTAFEERPQSPYYGSADATPLFLILLDEYERWTGDAHLVKRLEMEARAALRWIDAYGDRDGDGYVEYNSRNKETGLENQCWKDSWNSILFADSSPSRLPRATCEIQGYVYDAKMRCARLARHFWNDPVLAERLAREAAELKRRFNQDFWLPEREFFALALDGDGRKVDSLTSNIGHLLWSGIVDKEKAEACVRHLMGEQLFSGWGVRTMARCEGGYNPVGYHLGTVWPHDNSLIAWGLRRYGYRAEAAKVAAGMLAAAVYFKGRLPEAFAGYPRALTRFPVEYPTACSPQAWSAGTPLLLLRTLLGLEPDGEHLLADPAVPRMFGHLDLLSIPGRWGRLDVCSRGTLELADMDSSLPFTF